MVAFLDYLPRGSTLSDETWKGRHVFLQWVLLGHVPALLAFGLVRGYAVDYTLEAVAAPTAFLLLSRVLRSRRLAGLAVTAGLAASSAALVVLADGAIEAHFHFFVTIGLIALYQDWVPFGWNIVFTVFSHGIGSGLLPGQFFSHPAGQQRPWTWSVVHGVAVLAACASVLLFVRFTENDQRRATELRSELVEGNRRRFTADLLVNLARRNQNLIYRQLDLLNRLEEHERDAEQLSHLFQLDHLATRIRRNAESLLVLSGEEPARKWGQTVLLVDVVRAAIAEIEELDRVDFAVDESLTVSGRAVADSTHLLAELIENAVHFSPPGLSVMIRTRPYLPQPGAQVLTIEDWGVGMSQADLADANDLLRRPREVDLATSQRLGLHVVARLASRYGIVAALEGTPGGGVTAVVVLPAALFTDPREDTAAPAPAVDPEQLTRRTPVGAGVGRGSSAVGYADGSGPDGYADGSGPTGYADGSVRTGAEAPSGTYGAGNLHRPLPAPRGTDPAGPPARPTGAAAGAPTGRQAGSRGGDWTSWWPLPTDRTGPDGRSPRPPAAAPDPPPPTTPDPLDGDPLDGDPLDGGPLDGDPLDGDPLGGTALPDLGLARRTPQANLADELRRPADPAAAAPPTHAERDPARASSALSRFQATQRAAREGERRGGTTDGKARP